MHSSPNIWRSSVIRWVWKYELSKKGVTMEILSEAEVFLVKKRVILVIFQISESKERQKTDKIRSMTKKSHQKYWALKWKFFPNKRLFKNLGPRNMFPPPNSAPSLRLWWNRWPTCINYPLLGVTMISLFAGKYALVGEMRKPWVLSNQSIAHLSHSLPPTTIIYFNFKQMRSHTLNTELSTHYT